MPTFGIVCGRPARSLIKWNLDRNRAHRARLWTMFRLSDADFVAATMFEVPIRSGGSGRDLAQRRRR